MRGNNRETYNRGKVQHARLARTGVHHRHVDNPYLHIPRLEYSRRMDWDGLFDDLEDQLASGWEAERAALNAESERLRIARLPLRSRLATLARSQEPVTVALADDTSLTGHIADVGADWTALATAEGRTLVLLPEHAVVAWGMPHGALLATTSAEENLPAVRSRMTFGFVLRNLARRRARVIVRTRDSKLLAGTIDRAGADHLDLALHDPSEPRRAQSVRGFRLIPFSGVLSIAAAASAFPGSSV